MQFADYFSKLCLFVIPIIAVCFFIGLFSHGTGDLDLFVLLFGLLMLSVAALWSNFTNGEWFFPKGGVIVSLLGYWMVVWFSVLFSTYLFNSILFALIFSVLPFVFFVIVLSGDPWRWLQRSGWALGFGIVALAVFALLQFFVLEPGARVHLPMRNPNNLSVIFNMALFPMFCSYLLAKDRTQELVASLCVFVLVLALLVTQSRAAFLVFGLALFVFFLLVRRTSTFSLLRFLSLPLFAVLSFFVIDFLSQGAFAGGLGRLAGVENGELTERSVFERVLIWKSTWALIQDHFWTGTGLGTFIYYYPRYQSSQDFTEGYFSHMDPLQFWAEMGVFGTLAFYVVVTSILCRTFYVGLRADKGNPLLVWMYACFCGLLALFLHTHLSFHLYIPVILFVAAALMAGWYLCSEALMAEKRREVQLPSLLARRGAMVLAVFVFMSVVVWGARAAAGYYYVDQAARSIQTKEFDVARAMLDKASLYSLKNFSSYYHYEAEYYLNLLQREKEGREMLYNQALSNVDKAIEYNSGFVNLWNLKAQIYYTGAKEFEPNGVTKARELLVKSVEADPYFYDARMGLAYVYRLQGEGDKARVLMAEIDKLPRLKRYVERFNARER